jgi:hypothetical protein
VVLLWVFEAPEIILDKEVEIASALGIGLLILVLDKRSERDLHEKIHDIINKMNKLIHEQHKFIMDLGNKRKENNYELFGLPMYPSITALLK